MRVTEFTVEGTFAFPLDMLRYDACFPATSTDVHAIESSLDRSTRAKRTTVRLCHHHERVGWEPTEGRWNSFNWIVTDVNGRVKGFGGPR